MPVRRNTSCRVLLVAILLEPVCALAQEPTAVLSISLEAGAAMRPAPTVDINCPAHFAPAVIQAVGSPATDTRSTGYKTGPVVRRGVTTDRIVSVSTFQSKVDVEVLGCRLKRHFLPVSGRVTLEIHQGTSPPNLHVFTTEDETAAYSVHVDYRATLIGPERPFGMRHFSDPLMPATTDVLGTLKVWLRAGSATTEMCIDAETCQYGFESVEAGLVVTDAG